MCVPPDCISGKVEKRNSIPVVARTLHWEDVFEHIWAQHKCFIEVQMFSLFVLVHTKILQVSILEGRWCMPLFAQLHSIISQRAIREQVFFENWGLRIRSWSALVTVAGVSAGCDWRLLQSLLATAQQKPCKARRHRFRAVGRGGWPSL